MKRSLLIFSLFFALLSSSSSLAKTAAGVPACVEISREGRRSVLERLRFDEAGTLRLREIYSDDGHHLESRNRFDWTDKALRITTEYLENRSEQKFQTGPDGQTQRQRGGPGQPTVALFTLGTHGEFLRKIDGDETALLTWTGTFAPAPTRAFFEALYVGDAPSVLLPRHTAERGFYERMRPFAFTGNVVLVDKDWNGTERRLETRYRDGMLLEASDPFRKTVFTWSASALEREEVFEHGERVSQLTYAYEAGRLARTSLDAKGYTRDVRYLQEPDGLRRADITIAEASTSTKERVELRPCK